MRRGGGLMPHHHHPFGASSSGGSGGPGSSGIGRIGGAAAGGPSSAGSRKQPSPILNLSPGLEHSTSPVLTAVAGATAIAIPGGGSTLESRRASPSYVEFREFLQQSAGPSGMSSAASEAAREAAALELIDLCSRSSVAQKLEDAEAVDEVLIDENGHHHRRLIPASHQHHHHHHHHLLPTPHNLMPYGGHENAIPPQSQLGPAIDPVLNRGTGGGGPVVGTRKRPASRSTMPVMSLAGRRRRMMPQRQPNPSVQMAPSHQHHHHHHQQHGPGGSSGGVSSSSNFPLMCCVNGNSNGHPCQLNSQPPPHQHVVQHPHLHHHAMLGSWIAAPLYSSGIDYAPFVGNQNVNPVPSQRRSSRELSAAAAAVAQHAMLMQQRHQQPQPPPPSSEHQHHPSVSGMLRDPTIVLNQAARLRAGANALHPTQTPAHPAYMTANGPSSQHQHHHQQPSSSQLMTAPPPMTYNPQELLGMMMAMNDTSFRLWENTDALMQVAERMSQASKMPRGLSRNEIENLPLYRFSHAEPDEQSVCVVCQTDFEPKENIRTLLCSHIFHAKCVDKWLKTNRTCPICRNDSTPSIAE